MLLQESCHLPPKCQLTHTQPEPVILVKAVLSNYHVPGTESQFLPTTLNTRSAEPKEKVEAGATQRAH